MPFYSGGNYYTTFTAADKAAWFAAMKAALVDNCGWTLNNLSATELDATSVPTPEGLSMRLRLYDNAESGIIRHKFLAPADAYSTENNLTFDASWTYEVFACPHQALVHRIDYFNGALGEIGLWTTPFTPPDFHTGAPVPVSSFALGMAQLYNNWSNGYAIYGCRNYAVINGVASYFGESRILCKTVGGGYGGAIYPNRDAKMMIDAEIQLYNNNRIMGFYWDMVLVNKTFLLGEEFTFDGFIWRPLVQNAQQAQTPCMIKSVAP